MTRAIAMVLGGLMLMAGPAAAQVRVAINLNTHSEVTIDRPAAAIWPLIVDPSAWKQGAKSWHHAGPVGQLGEIRAAGDPADTGNVAYFIENVELVPYQRRTIKIYAPTGTLLGFAIWTLRESAGRTAVSYDVHSETLLDSARASARTPAELQHEERASWDANQKRFDRELLALKRLVEVER